RIAVRGSAGLGSSCSTRLASASTAERRQSFGHATGDGVGVGVGVGVGACGDGRTLIARAITMIAVTSESTDSTIIAIFAHGWRGGVSVGLNAVAFVNDR